MTAAQDILKLIETVDPSDTAKLDEIDCVVGNWISEGREGWSGYVCPVKFYTGPSYTRSRDALKAMRPDGWFGFIRIIPPDWNSVHLNRNHPFGNADSPKLPTEELAELHAIIQAIENERQSK